VVALFVRLKITLLANAFRRSIWQTIGFVVGSLYGLGVIVVLVAGMATLGSFDVALAGTVLLLAGTLVTLAWWVGPLFAFGVDATLDPQRFVMLPLPRRTLLAGLTAAGIVSVPGIVTVVTTLGATVGFWRNIAAWVAALIGGVLAVALCIVGSRAWTTALASLLESRRYREVVTVAAFVPLVLLGPAISWGAAQMSESGADPDALRAMAEQLAAIAGWTPLGAPWGLADAVMSGSWALAAARLGVGLVSLAAVWWVWDRALGRALVTPPAAGSTGRAKGLGWFGRFPATPRGAVAARAAIYWLRDPRYAGSLAVIPLIPVILLAVGRGSGSQILWIFAPAAAWLLGFSIVADLAFDYTAFALHVSTGISGRDDRWGRVIPVLVVGAPITAVFAVISVWIVGDWTVLPAILGASLGILLVSLGVSSAASSRFVYPVAKPGDSPFKSQQGAQMATMIAQMVTLFILIGLSLPVVTLALIAVLGDVGWAGWAAFVVGPVLGVVFLLLGIRLGARAYDRSAPELLAKMSSFA
jgi:ABC-2 type transport system permease protein